MSILSELPDLPPEEKDKIVKETIETVAGVLIFCMKVTKAENYIVGDVVNQSDGTKYELIFKKKIEPTI